MQRSYFCTLDIYSEEEDSTDLPVATLSIYQTNDFKNLLHLKLELNQGSDQ